jgi:hypothetical protein
MPTNVLQLPPVTGVFRLAMTFDVTGNNIVASGYADVPCQTPSSSPPPILVPISLSSVIYGSGTAGADGSFSVQTPANFPVGSISIQGQVPRTDGGEWPGSYTHPLIQRSDRLVQGVLQGRLPRLHFLLSTECMLEPG